MLKSYNNFFLYLPIILFSTTIISSLILSSSLVSADDSVVSNVAITVPASCTLSGTGMDSHTANINNGTYTTDIGTTTLKAYCNDSEGFAIYAIGYTGEEYGVTNLVGTNTGTTITTGTATTAGNPDISNWAMKLGTITSPTPTYPITIDNSFNNYHAVPSTYTKVAHRDSGTDTGTNAEGSTLTTTYAAYISKTQTADTYNGKVKYTMVHPANETPLQPQSCESGKICYFPNGSNVVGTMGQQSITFSATSATLLASNFSRQGYGFAGWSDSYDYATNQNAHFYGPNETISFTAGQYTDDNPGLSLYAIWIKSAGILQDQSDVDALCETGAGSLTTAPTDGTADLSSVSALTDQRDNQTYAIAKLADSNCWMIENLRLDSTAAHNSDGTLAQGYGSSTTYGNFAGLANTESPWGNNSTNSNSLYSTDGSNNTININANNAGYRFPRYNNANTSARASNPDNNGEAIYSYGNYYTWHAAIADLVPMDVDNDSVASTSLCPAGWRLPTGGKAYATGNTGGVNVTGSPSTYRAFYNLSYKIMDEIKTAYEDTPNGGYARYSNSTTNTAGNTASKAFRKYPNNFVYSGRILSGSVGYRGDNGLFWSSTTERFDSAYDLYMNYNSITPGTQDGYKYVGASIRCYIYPK